ncbi:F0F1 ATP synthase subunit A [Thiomicrorhabdus sp. ZW0627]|uniref:F0F1 ATP synthase subunit A n=1 Tax=Thiomicrorhabdus sp. ZW0627 TaxID=3039774 RepID=UPI0024364652|nr:F0F1 ATP synthase subunit A [Thiomicrorhabdus sp. ZW0627]MDG6773825.1 F0F1 ATP synthase subunit A [Thiomicrorhabdus sp. ZW0627]
MQESGLDIGIVFHVGSFEITDTVVTSFGITVLLGVVFWFLTRALTRTPGRIQTVLEAVVSTIEDAVASVAPDHAKQLTPFIGSLWIFILISNLIGLIPGLHSPTRDFSATAGLAVMVFFAVHWFGIRILGFKAYLRHFIRPSPLLVPFNIISEISRTIALSVRLFGNMMSLEMTALLILMVAGFLAPVPVLMLHIVEALVQAYIFGILALVYIASGLQSQQIHEQKNKE